LGLSVRAGDEPSLNEDEMHGIEFADGKLAERCPLLQLPDL
jgi:hypothetical protein